MTGRFDLTRRGSVSIPEFNGMDASPAADTGSEVCGCRCDDTGTGVCGRRERRVALLRRGAVPLGEWWRRSVPVGLDVETGMELAGSLHWNQGVSGGQLVPLHPQVPIGIWSGNKGWFA